MRRSARRSPSGANSRCSSAAIERVILDVEHVRRGQLAVPRVRPQGQAVRGANEPSAHADALARASDAPFEEQAHAEGVSDLAGVDLALAEPERRGASGDAEPRDAGEDVADLLGQPVPEIVVRRIPAHVGKREHGDGGELRRVERPRGPGPGTLAHAADGPAGRRHGEGGDGE